MAPLPTPWYEVLSPEDRDLTLRVLREVADPCLIPNDREFASVVGYERAAFNELLATWPNPDERLRDWRAARQGLAAAWGYPHKRWAWLAARLGLAWTEVRELSDRLEHAVARDVELTRLADEDAVRFFRERVSEERIRKRLDGWGPVEAETPAMRRTRRLLVQGALERGMDVPDRLRE